MRGAFWVVWLLAGCKTVHSVDVASHEDAATAAQTETHETKSTGPEHIVMTVEEYSQLCPGPSSPDGSDTRASAAHELGGIARLAPGGLSAAPHPDVPANITPILVKRTVTVTDRGPSLDDLRTISSLQSKLNSATEIKTKDESKPGGIFSLWFLVGLLPLVAGVLIWKFQPSLFGVAWGALKGLLK